MINVQTTSNVDKSAFITTFGEEETEDNMKTLKREIKVLEAEKAMLESYQMKTNSFASVMRDRLKKSNPSKYFKCSFLLKDIIILKKKTLQK